MIHANCSVACDASARTRAAMMCVPGASASLPAGAEGELASAQTAVGQISSGTARAGRPEIRVLSLHY